MRRPSPSRVRVGAPPADAEHRSLAQPRQLAELLLLCGIGQRNDFPVFHNKIAYVNLQVFRRHLEELLLH